MMELKEYVDKVLKSTGASEIYFDLKVTVDSANRITVEKESSKIRFKLRKKDE